MTRFTFKSTRWQQIWPIAVEAECGLKSPYLRAVQTGNVGESECSFSRAEFWDRASASEIDGGRGLKEVLMRAGTAPGHRGEGGRRRGGERRWVGARGSRGAVFLQMSHCWWHQRPPPDRSTLLSLPFLGCFTPLPSLPSLSLSAVSLRLTSLLLLMLKFVVVGGFDQILWVYTWILQNFFFVLLTKCCCYTLFLHYMTVWNIWFWLVNSCQVFSPRQLIS